MFALTRHAAAIGLMAWFSPVHTTAPEQRLQALSEAPAALIRDAAQARFAAEAMAAARALSPGHREIVASAFAPRTAPPTSSR